MDTNIDPRTVARAVGVGVGLLLLLTLLFGPATVMGAFTGTPTPDCGCGEHGNGGLADPDNWGGDTFWLSGHSGIAAAQSNESEPGADFPPAGAGQGGGTGAGSGSSDNPLAGAGQGSGGGGGSGDESAGSGNESGAGDDSPPAGAGQGGASASGGATMWEGAGAGQGAGTTGPDPSGQSQGGGGAGGTGNEYNTTTGQQEATNGTSEDDPLTPPDGDTFGLSPAGWFASAMWGVAEQALASVQASVNVIAASPVGLPAPGSFDDPSSWINPQNGFWPGVYNAIGVSQLIGLFMLLIQTAMATTYSPEVKRNQAWRLSIAWLMWAGTTVFAPFLLHTFGMMATTIAPSGEDFMADPQGMVSFAMGWVLLAILIYVASGVVATGLVVMFVVYVIAHFIVLMWPMMWPAWASRGQTQSYGATGIYLTGTVLVIGVLQSVILLALFGIDWMTSPLGPIGALAAIIAGLLFALVYMPYHLLKQAHAGAAVLLGTNAAMSAGGMLKNAPQEVRERREQFTEYYQSFTSGGGGEDRPDFGGSRPVGAVGNSGVSGNEPRKPLSGTATGPSGVDASAWDDRETDRIDRMYN